MNTPIIVAIIGALGLISAALINTQASAIRRIFDRGDPTRLMGDWKSTWITVADEVKQEHAEFFHIASQHGDRVNGTVTSDEYAGMVCNIDGYLHEVFCSSCGIHPMRRERGGFRVSGATSSSGSRTRISPGTH